MKLYDYVLSGNCYKVRLLAGMLGLTYESVPVDFYPGRKHKSEAFLDINPLGQLPVFDDGGLVLRDAQAILIYLAAKYDPAHRWWPAENPAMMGQVAQWLGFADQLTASASAARLHDVLGYKLDVEKARTEARRLLRVLEDHLSTGEIENRLWLVGTAPTIADIACFPYTALAGDGGIETWPYPAVRRWHRRIMDLPGYLDMPGINSIQ